MSDDTKVRGAVSHVTSSMHEHCYLMTTSWFCSEFKHLMNTAALIGQPSSEAPPPSRLSLSYKVMKSLDRDVYRNLEFDVWQDTCKGKLAGHMTQ